MKRSDIRVGGIYSDGKSHRLVQAEGPEFTLSRHSQMDRDCLQIVRLDGKRESCPAGLTPNGLQITHATRTSMASWAKEEVTMEEVERRTNHAAQMKKARKAGSPSP